MTYLVGLMGNQKEAEKAISALAKIHKDDIEIHTVEEWPEGQAPQLKLMPSFASGYEPTATMAPFTAVSPLSELSAEETDFFKRSVRNDGVLVVVNVADEERLPKVKRVLQEHSVQMITRS